MPGGKVERGETSLQAAIREIHEEFSLPTDAANYTYLGTDSRNSGIYDFYFLPGSPLVPGKYKTNDDPPEEMELIVSDPDDPNYIGTDFRIWLANNT